MKNNIVIVGYMGSTGATKIAEARRSELMKRFRPDYIDRIHTDGIFSEWNPESLAMLPGCETFHVGEGGVLKTLYELAVSHHCGMRIELKRIPFLQSTIEICELYELNPYRLLSDGWVVLCDDEGFETLDKTLDVPHAKIGYLTNDNDKVVIDKMSLQHIDKPSPDELYKIIKG